MKDTILSWTSVHWPEQSSIDLFVEHQLFVVLFPWRLEQNGKNRPLYIVHAYFVNQFFTGIVFTLNEFFLKKSYEICSPLINAFFGTL